MKIWARLRHRRKLKHTRSRNGSAMRLMGLIAAGLVLTACSSTPPVPQDRFYRLDQPARFATERIIVGQLAVAPLETDGIYRERSVLFIDQAAPLEIQRYHYHFWSSEPSALLQEQVIAFCRSNGIADQITRFNPAQTADWIVRGHVLRFEREISATTSRVSVAVDLELFRKDEHVPALAKEYRAAVDTARPMHDVAAGFSKAVDQILAQFFQDVARVAGTR